jgi:hypothetical protein
LTTGLLKARSAWRASDWPATAGVVLESTIEEQSDAESTRHIAHIRYEYQVGRQRYVSSRISFTPQALDSSRWSIELVRKYPAGSSVQVHYDPADPWESALFVGTTPMTYAQPIVGAVLVVFSLSLFAHASRPSARHEEQNVE